MQTTHIKLSRLSLGLSLAFAAGFSSAQTLSNSGDALRQVQPLLCLQSPQPHYRKSVAALSRPP